MKETLAALAAGAGALRVGFAEAGAVDAACADAYRQWLAEGRNGSMGYLSNYPDIRADAGLLLAPGREARTVMVCAFPYYHSDRQDSGAARFSMYAHGTDYHEVLRRRLRPVLDALAEAGETGRICVDSAPVMERYWAVKAGVGFRGMNSQLIVPGMGSYFFLAEVVMTAVVPPDAPCSRQRCDGCGRCAAACPGGAIGQDGSFDARRCLSYLTIEHRGELPAAIERPGGGSRRLCDAMGGMVYGCDVCQAVCPHNARPPETTVAEFGLRPALRSITCDDILSMTPRQFSAIFSHSAVKRVKLEGLRRNAMLCLGREMSAHEPCLGGPDD